MPYMPPQRRAAGPRAWTRATDNPHPAGQACDCDWDNPATWTAANLRHRAIQPLTQDRYGPNPPTRIRRDYKTDVRLTAEGNGTVATCLGCGWVMFSTTDHEAKKQAREHSCPAKPRWAR